MHREEDGKEASSVRQEKGAMQFHVRATEHCVV